MDWNRVEGNWKQVKGKVKEQWGKLTDDDLDVIAGKGPVGRKNPGTLRLREGPNTKGSERLVRTPDLEIKTEKKPRFAGLFFYPIQLDHAMWCKPHHLLSAPRWFGVGALQEHAAKREV